MNRKPDIKSILKALQAAVVAFEPILSEGLETNATECEVRLTFGPNDDSPAHVLTIGYATKKPDDGDDDEDYRR